VRQTIRLRREEEEVDEEEDEDEEIQVCKSLRCVAAK
jgi:hypothetical protein